LNTFHNEFDLLHEKLGKKKFNKILYRTKQKTNLAFSTTEIMPNYSNKFALLLKTTSIENLENKNY
jgi:hypothetical protein